MERLAINGAKRRTQSTSPHVRRLEAVREINERATVRNSISRFATVAPASPKAHLRHETQTAFNAHRIDGGSPR